MGRAFPGICFSPGDDFSRVDGDQTPNPSFPWLVLAPRDGLRRDPGADGQAGPQRPADSSCPWLVLPCSSRPEDAAGGAWPVPRPVRDGAPCGYER